jgi:hypothetical protein
MFSEQEKETIVSVCHLLGVNRQVYYCAIKAKKHNESISKKSLDW